MRRSSCILCLALLCALLGGCGRTGYEAPPLREPAGMALDTAVAERGEFYNVSTYEGLVMPRVLELSFPVTGLLGEVSVCVGSRVRAGDVLAKLDAAAYESALAAARSGLAYNTQVNQLTQREAALRIDIARLELEELRENGADSTSLRLQEISIQEQESKLRQDEALWALSKAESEKNIAVLELQLRSSVMTAPCDGTVVYCTAAQGGYAMAGTALVWLADEADLYISTEYLTADLLARADQVYATAAGERVEVVHQPMDRVEYLSKTAAGYPLRSSFQIADDHGHPVESGMSAVLYRIYNYAEDALTVPADAVRRDGTAGYYVYKVVDGVQIRQNVVRGAFNDATVQIVEGLEEGDVVYVGN